MAGQALQISQNAAAGVTELRTELRGNVSEILGTVQALALTVADLARTGAVHGQQQLHGQGSSSAIPLLQHRTVNDAAEGGVRRYGGGQRVTDRVAGMARADDLSGDEQRRAAELLWRANQVGNLPPRAHARTREGGPEVSPVMKAFLHVGLRSVEDTYAAEQQDTAYMEQYATDLRRARNKKASEPVAMASLFDWQAKIHTSTVLTPSWRIRHGEDLANACVFHFSIVTHLATRPGKLTGWALAAAYDKRVVDNWDSIDFLELCTSKAYMDGNLDEAMHWESYQHVKDKIERAVDVKKVKEKVKTFCKICKQMVLHKWEDCRRGEPAPPKTAAPAPRKAVKEEEKKN
jgi:hypothetical protein